MHTRMGARATAATTADRANVIDSLAYDFPPRGDSGQ